MNKLWTDNAWEDYEEWQKIDKNIVKRINKLLKSIDSTPFEGIGKPEPLKYGFHGYWSRRITDEHRLVYRISGKTIEIIQCKFHYEE